MGNLFIVLGVSGSGKTSLVRAVAGEDVQYSEYAMPGIRRLVTTTTRLPRAGEQEGKDYYFRTPMQFEDDWTSGALLERASYGSHQYGLWRTEVEQTLAQGDGIIIMEVVGAQVITAWKPDTHLIGIIPPAIEVLGERMRVRGDLPNVIAHRLEAIASEQARITALVENHPYAHTIDNSQAFDNALRELRTYIGCMRHGY